jgi:hypothetical protein
MKKQWSKPTLSTIGTKADCETRIKRLQELVKRYMDEYIESNKPEKRTIACNYMDELTKVQKQYSAIHNKLQVHETAEC